MGNALVPLTVSAPGFFGLNTQKAGSVLPMGWATKAQNCIFDTVGRLASRRGYQHNHATVVTNTPTLRQIHEYIDDMGNKLKIFAADNKLWKEVAGVITDITGTATTPTGDDWQFANFNGTCVAYQDGHAPIEITSTGGSFANAGGTQYNGSMVLSAYGRLWTVVDNQLRYSDLLINDYDGGSSGAFDLAEFWPAGMDEAVAIADFNGGLIVFGKHSIIIYENADDVANMAIVESIGGIGCPYRDTVQRIGDDLVFLSDSGLRSLKRTVIDGSSAINEISKNVRDELVEDLSGEVVDQVKSLYNETLGFYLISLPVKGVTYYFDVRLPLEDGTWRVTKWNIAPTALHYTQDNVMLLANTAGYLSTYEGYRDAVSSAGAGGTTYSMDFEGVWNDFGQEVAQNIKIPKNVSMLAAGTPGGTVAFKWAFDYQDTFSNVTMDFSGNAPPTYGGGFTWGGVYTYSTGSGTFQRVRNTVGSAGQVIKIGMTTTIDGFEFGLQRVDLLAKIGRIGL